VQREVLLSVQGYGVVLPTRSCGKETAAGRKLDCSDWVILEPGISCLFVEDCGKEPTTGNISAHAVTSPELVLTLKAAICCRSNRK
jgi:hypothetical protein